MRLADVEHGLVECDSVHRVLAIRHEKNRKLATYRTVAYDLGNSTDLRFLRDDIDIAMGEANVVMNELLQRLHDFEKEWFDVLNPDQQQAFIELMGKVRARFQQLQRSFKP